MKFNLIFTVGWATIFTFAMSVAIFFVERLGFAMMYALQPFPFLTFAETQFIFILIIFTFWFIVFALIGVARLKRSMP